MARPARPSLRFAPLLAASFLLAGCPAAQKCNGLGLGNEIAHAELPVSPNEGGEWLHTERNHIKDSAGKNVHLRGVNLHDTRGCDACTFEAPNPAEVMRRADAAIDDWKANFVRLTLESYKDDAGRTNFKSASESDAYLEDIKKIVTHITKKPGVYLMLAVWHDPSLDKDGWPTDDTNKLWAKLVPAFADNPRVLFAVATEPERNEDGAMDAAVWTRMNKAVEAIRAAEGTGKKHIVVVQGTAGWGRRLDYYLDHPITAGGGTNIAYETHVYDPKAKVDAIFDGPVKTLPVIVGEFGPEQQKAHMSIAECEHLMNRAEAAEVPYLAWTFHMRCPPNLLEDTSKGGCGVGMPLQPSEWGKVFKARIAQPWAAPAPAPPSGAPAKP